MPTTKTIKIQKNKILTYSINKTGFQTVNKSIVVTEDTTINENMVSQSGSPILQLGDRLLGISSFVCYFTPSGDYDVDSLKYVLAKQTTGSGLTNIQVVKELWLTQVETALGIETPKGSSNNFIFTYNGSTWDLTGAVTVGGISTQDLNDIYGITFTGTASSGNAITVTETQYNKFACYILDANYRSKKSWKNSSATMLEIYNYYNNNPTNCSESGTYFYNLIKNNTTITDYPIFNAAKDLGIFILPNKIKINAVVANAAEIQSIYENREFLDSCDPIIQSGSTDYNLTSWADTWSSCTYYSPQDYYQWYGWYKSSNGGWYHNRRDYDYYIYMYSSLRFLPIFEVPVM